MTEATPCEENVHSERGRMVLVDGRGSVMLKTRVTVGDRLGGLKGSRGGLMYLLAMAIASRNARVATMLPS